MKNKSQYRCQICGFVAMKWMGRCPECLNWNSLVEEAVRNDKKKHKSQNSLLEPKLLSSIKQETSSKVDIPDSELNRVLGNGLTLGSTVLIGGEPGIGKSTLLLQFLNRLKKSKVSPPFLYISGEESPTQIKSRADRLGIDGDHISILHEMNCDVILDYLEKHPTSIVVLDSIQTTYSPELTSIPGSIGQIREVADRLVRFAKLKSLTLFLIGHVTKDGAIAGPKTLEHLVDTVLYFESNQSQDLRILRTIKNRFGPTNEIGVFQMKQTGLDGVENASEILIRDRPRETIGSVIYPAIEGTRPLLIEIQSLVSKTAYSVPMRNTVGFDKNRLTMLLAVIEKKIGVPISQQDVYLNVVGGIRLQDTASDLPVVLSVLSSYLNTAFPKKMISFGEIGLSGEIRSCPMVEPRISEASKLGFESYCGPKLENISFKNLNTHVFDTIVDVQSVFEINFKKDFVHPHKTK